MDFTEKRKRMVDDEIIARGISDPRVLSAFREVERHKFISLSSQGSAYEDHPLPIGRGQTISQPYMAALMTECLALKGGEKVLEVGTGSGYQAAILSKLCREVFTIEREENLMDNARKVLAEEGYANIKFRCGDGTKGLAEEAPFDGIIVTAASPDIPVPLTEQLADGGRLVIPVGMRYGQMLVLIERKGKAFIKKDICGCVFVPLVGEYGWPEQ